MMAKGKKVSKKVEKVVEKKPVVAAKSSVEETAKQALIGRGIAEPTNQQISDYITRMGLE